MSNDTCTNCGKPANEVDNIVVDGEVYCNDECAEACVEHNGACD